MKDVKLQQVPVGDISLSGLNPRKDIEKSEDFPELVASIAGGGVRGPVQVRDDIVNKGKYILISGERRLRASIAAGEAEIPALVYAGIDDADAMDLMFVENRFRQPLKPMEEAAEIEQLAARLGGDVKAMAAKSGMTERWVRLRANINANLIKEWRAAIEKIPEFSTWSIKHLTLIARLPEHIQKDLLAGYKDSWRGYKEVGKESVRDLEARIAGALNLLSKAKWNLEDETLLPKAGACTNCVKRSGHQPFLWFDSDDQAEAGDQCLDDNCWKAKAMSLLARRAKEIKEQYPNMVLITTEPTRGRDLDSVRENIGSPLSSWQYKTCPKSAKGAVPALYVNNKSAGKLTFIRLDSAIGSSPARKAGPKPLKERKAALEAKRWSQVLIDLKEKVEKTEVAGIRCTDRVTAVMAMVAFLGNCSIGYEVAGDLDTELNRLLADKKNGKFQALDYLWRSFKPTLNSMLTYSGPISQTPKRYIKEAEWIAGIIGADLKAMFADVSKQKGFTEPKSWKSLAADGTEKVKSKKAEKKCKSKKAKVKSTKPAASETEEAEVRTCRVCGCTDTTPCMVDGEPCSWVEKGLCSACDERII